MKVYTLNSFAQNNETGFFDEYYDNHGVFSDLKEAELEYLKLKTENIKSVAEKRKSQIDIRVYNALINWEVR